MRKTILLLLVFANTFNLFCQDLIITKNAERIEAKVVEIGDATVKYKKWDYLDGPNYTILKSDISSILYQNGEVEVFADNGSRPVQSQEQAPVQPREVPANETAVENRLWVEEPVEPQISWRDTCFKKEKFNFYFTLGAAFPLGKYGKTDDADFSAIYSYYDNLYDSPDAFTPTFGAASKVGALFGINFHIPVFRKNHHVIALLIRSDLHFSTISQKEKSDFIKYELQMWKDVGDQINAEYGVNGYMYQMGNFSSYWDCALRLGLDYTWYLNKNVGFFINGNMGVQMNMVSRTKLINAMGGTVMGDVISIGFLYSSGTAHKHNMKLEEYYSGHLDIPPTPVSLVSSRLRTQYVAVLLGFHL